MKLKPILILCLSFAIFSNNKIFAQKKPYFLSAVKSMDTSKVFPIDSSLIALNPTRAKFGVQKIEPTWRSVQHQMYMSHSSILLLVNEKKEAIKSISGGGGRHPQINSIEHELANGDLNGKSLRIRNGKVYMTETYQNNELHGLTEYFDTSEQLIFKIEFKNNAPWEGQYVNYQGIDMQRFQLDSYQAGLKHGKSGRYINGLPDEEFFHEKGVLVKKLRYYSNEFAGILFTEEVYENEQKKSQKTWHNNQTPQGITTFGMNGKRHGLGQSWDESGKLRWEGEFINGEEHGRQFSLNANTGAELTKWYWNGKRLDDEAQYDRLVAKYPKPEVNWEEILKTEKENKNRKARWHKNLNTNTNVIATLEEALLSKHHSSQYFRTVMDQMDRTKDITLIEPLRQFNAKLETQMRYEYDAEMHPVTNENLNHFLLAGRRILLTLELEKMNFKTDEERIDFLIQRMKSKIIGEQEYVDAEYFHLKNYANQLESRAIQLIDKEEHHYLKLIGLLFLHESKNENLEKITLDRIETYRGKSPVFGWMVQILTTDGGELGLEYLVNQVEEPDYDARREVIFAIKKLGPKHRTFLNKKKAENPLLNERLNQRLSVNKRALRKKFSASNFNYMVKFSRGNFTRSTWAGEYFGDKTTEELIQILEAANEDLDDFDERVFQVKAAYILGDRQLEGNLKLTADQAKRVEIIVKKYIENNKMESGGSWSPPKQIERLWLLAEPTLFQYIESEDRSILQFVYRNLGKMRNRALVEKIISSAEKCKGKKSCENYLYVLNYMQTPPESYVPRRKSMTETEFQKINDELIIDFLEKMKTN